MYNLNWEVTRMKRQIKFQRIRIKFHDILGFENMSKINLDPNDTGFTITAIDNGYIPWKFPLKITINGSEGIRCSLL